MTDWPQYQAYNKPRRQVKVPTTTQISQDGMYQVGEAVYKVVKRQDKNGLYAKLFRPAVKNEDGSVNTRASFVYAPGEIYRIKAEDKMTAEQATKFGKLYSVCCNCAKDLSREESIRRGYGPTCADNNDWPYDHNAD